MPEAVHAWPPQPSSRRFLLVVRASLCLLLLGLPIGAQNPPSGMPRLGGTPPSQRQIGGIDYDDSGDSVMDERRLKMLNAERQKSLVADTNKLLRLATELNRAIAASNSDTLTPAQLAQLAEIEKLAHNVKEKMSTSVRPAPVFSRPVFPADR